MPFYGRSLLGQSLGTLMPNKANLYYGSPVSGTGTNSALGNGNLRASPLWVPRSVTIDRIKAEITTVGDVGSRLRLGIYGDSGDGYPGALLVDAGTINGDSATEQEIAISQLLASGLYWLAAAVQNVSTVTPTVRTANIVAPSVGISGVLNSGPAGYLHSGVTGALPATFTATPSTASAVPRILVRVTT